jgi:hypothetical protein
VAKVGRPKFFGVNEDFLDAFLDSSKASFGDGSAVAGCPGKSTNLRPAIFLVGLVGFEKGTAFGSRST